MKDLDKKTCAQWRDDTRLLFKGGRDPRLEAFGSEWNRQKINTVRSQDLSTGQLKRWNFRRIPLQKVKDDHEHQIGSITLVIPPLKPGIIGRWPEFLLVLIVASSLAGMRILYQLFY
jgi:hypothetical protein